MTALSTGLSGPSHWFALFSQCSKIPWNSGRVWGLADSLDFLSLWGVSVAPPCPLPLTPSSELSLKPLKEPTGALHIPVQCDLVVETHFVEESHRWKNAALKWTGWTVFNAAQRLTGFLICLHCRPEWDGRARGYGLGLGALFKEVRFPTARKTLFI